MMARSRSVTSQPAGRPVRKELVPETNSVQSPWLSSIHRPASFFLTIRLILGGGLLAGRLGLSGGSKVAPELGGGFSPPCGPIGKSTTAGGGEGFRVATRPARMVDPLPDSNIAI